MNSVRDVLFLLAVHGAKIKSDRSAFSQIISEGVDCPVHKSEQEQIIDSELTFIHGNGGL